MQPLYPPGPRPDPIIGSLRHFQRNRLGFLTACRDYGDIVHLRLGPRHGYLLNHPDLVRYVLVEGAAHFEKTPLFKKNTRRIIGTGLLTSEDPLHKRQRKLMQPAFHHQRIAGYAEVMTAHTTRLLDTWRSGETRDVQHDMTRLTLDIVSETLFGADVSVAADAVCSAIESGLHYVVKRTLSPLAPPDWIPTPGNRAARKDAALLDRVIMDIINTRRASGDDRGDLLSMLLMAQDDESGGMSDQQVRDEVMTLFIAGHETTANALTWALMLLAQNPAAAETLRAELDGALGGHAPTMSDLPTLPYTEMVVRESMRLYPPAWIIPRLAVDDVTVGGYPVAKGSILLSCPYTMHRDPRFFPDPERFMPERFAGDYEERIPRYAYFPFGGGPRVCIGSSFAHMEARLILAAIVQRYRFDLVPGQELSPQPLVTLRPRGGVMMQVSTARQ